MRRRAVALLAAALLAVAGDAAALFGLGDEDKQLPPESETALPAFPQDADLLEFYVSAVTPNRFFIDSRTLAAGADGIVRYALVILTGGGATNVTFEGMRCATGEYKIYATGRGDRSWSATRDPAWRPIENKPINRHHAALSKEFFCPLGNPIMSAGEGLDALKRGRHPSLP